MKQSFACGRATGASIDAKNLSQRNLYVYPNPVEPHDVLKQDLFIDALASSHKKITQSKLKIVIKGNKD